MQIRDINGFYWEINSHANALTISEINGEYRGIKAATFNNTTVNDIGSTDRMPDTIQFLAHKTKMEDIHMEIGKYINISPYYENEVCVGVDVYNSLYKKAFCFPLEYKDLVFQTTFSAIEKEKQEEDLIARFHFSDNVFAKIQELHESIQKDATIDNEILTDWHNVQNYSESELSKHMETVEQAIDASGGEVINYLPTDFIVKNPEILDQCIQLGGKHIINEDKMVNINHAMEVAKMIDEVEDGKKENQGHEQNLEPPELDED